MTNMTASDGDTRWGESRKTERQRAIEKWAVIGLSNFARDPAPTIIGARTHQVDLEGHGWRASVANGMASYFRWARS